MGRTGKTRNATGFMGRPGLHWPDGQVCSHYQSQLEKTLGEVQQLCDGIPNSFSLSSLYSRRMA